MTAFVSRRSRLIQPTAGFRLTLVFGLLDAKTPLAFEAPIYIASGRHHAANLPSKLLLQRRSPGHELEAESIVDHCIAAGRKCDALAVDPRHVLAFGGWAMRKPSFGRQFGGGSIEFALAQSIDECDPACKIDPLTRGIGVEN